MSEVWVPSAYCTCPFAYCSEVSADGTPPGPCSLGHRPVPTLKKDAAPTTCPACGSDDPKVRLERCNSGLRCIDAFHDTPEQVGGTPRDEVMAALERVSNDDYYDSGHHYQHAKRGADLAKVRAFIERSQP